MKCSPTDDVSKYPGICTTTCPTGYINTICKTLYDDGAMNKIESLFSKCGSSTGPGLVSGCLKDFANISCKDVRDLVDDLDKKGSPIVNANTVSSLANIWNDLVVNKKLDDSYHELGRSIASIPLKLNCMVDEMNSRFKPKTKFKMVSPSFQTGLEQGGNSVNRNVIFLTIVVAMIILGIFLCIPAFQKSPLLLFIPLLLLTAGMLLITGLVDNKK